MGGQGRRSRAEGKRERGGGGSACRRRRRGLVSAPENGHLRHPVAATHQYPEKVPESRPADPPEVRCASHGPLSPVKSTNVLARTLDVSKAAMIRPTMASASASASPNAPRRVWFLCAQPQYCISGWSSAVVCTCEKGTYRKKGKAAFFKTKFWEAGEGGLKQGSAGGRLRPSDLWGPLEAPPHAFCMSA